MLYISNYSTEVQNLQGVYQIKTTTEGENYKLQVLQYYQKKLT